MSQKLLAIAATKGAASKASKKSNGSLGARAATGRQNGGRAPKGANKINVHDRKDSSSSDLSNISSDLENELFQDIKLTEKQQLQEFRKALKDLGQDTDEDQSESHSKCDTCDSESGSNSENDSDTNDDETDSASETGSYSEYTLNSSANTSTDSKRGDNTSKASNKSDKANMELHNSTSDSEPSCSFNCKPASGKRSSNTITNDFNNNEPTSPKKAKCNSQRKDKSSTKAPSCPLVRKSLPAAAKPGPLLSKTKLNTKADSNNVKTTITKAPSCPWVRKSLPAAANPRAANPKNNVKASKPNLPKSCPMQPKAEQKIKSSPMPTEPSAAAGSKAGNSAKSVRQAAPLTQCFELHNENSIEEGRRKLDWILSPMSASAFFAEYWEQKACMVSRKQHNYFANLVSLPKIVDVLSHNHLEFTTNIDVASGMSQTHNPEGRATAATVWGYYEDGCSVRILNASSYFQDIRSMCSTLQEYFHCHVGANVYLTPPESHGFAPHFDDIETFVLQVEGSTHWRLYMPPLPSDVLARESSGSYQQEQLGEPIFDELMSPGDVLYFPRGTVHQAINIENRASLHITLRVYQKQSYADLMEQLIPMVLKSAIKDNLNLRRGLPLSTWRHAGLVRADNSDSKKRAEFVRNVLNLTTECLAPSNKQIDAAVDQLAKRFQHEALPPTLQPEEKKRTVFATRKDINAHGKGSRGSKLTEHTLVRLLRANILRLVAEDGKYRIYYYVNNGLEYCKYDANFMEIKSLEVAAVEKLIHAYPAYIPISQLPLSNEKKKVELATVLWEMKLIMTEKPLK